MMQAQFEDYQLLKERIHAALEKLGIQKCERAYWFENPPISEESVESIRLAIGASNDTQLIAYYPHSDRFGHYKTVKVGDETFRWMAFQNGHFIKFAAEITSPVEQVLLK